MRRLSLLLLAAGLCLAPRAALAFCGFYVAGADARLVNNATSVVLMRDGTRTVLSMQNNYEGPPQDFALVVPVPVVLREQDVKTLPPEIFDRVDRLAAPRLVEYWEQDPCAHANGTYEFQSGVALASEVSVRSEGLRRRDLGVRVEAQFAVGEYQIVILSAEDSAGLDVWLRQEGYKIPHGAERALRPYVQQGMKFFVARVDIDKVERDEHGRTTLSPLRFHYDSDSFNLPVRLGLLNSGGKQDLLVHVLAREVRYQVANYPNVAIPTNIAVADATRAAFGAFYAALYDRVQARNPGAVVTEYAWSAGSCDPCPDSVLTLDELVTLGADVLPTYTAALGGGRAPTELVNKMPADFVLTRLHARYGPETLGDDLVFQAAPPISGGREVTGPSGQLETGAAPASFNNFQARYIIRHPWTGPATCEQPRWGVWGGPPGGAPPTQVARDLAFAPREAPLASFLAQDVVELAVQARPLADAPIEPPRPEPLTGCGRCDAGSAGAGVGLLLAALWRRRRRVT